jgi:ketosteroid isomerase-like protein
MSEENVEIVRSAFQAFEEGGVDPALAFVHPDIEWEARLDLPDSDVYRGHTGVRRLFARFTEVMEDIWFRPDELIDAGDRVVVPLSWGGTGKSSGVAFEEREETWVYSFRDAKIARVQEYATKQQALKAAGLSE